jgi:hypothetical protein
MDERMLDEVEDAGRDTDTIVGHLTAGEIVIPAQIASQPEVQQILKAIFDGNEVSMDEFTVGHPSNKTNPETGYPEFFLKKAFKAVTGAVKSVVGGVAKVLGLAPKAPDMTKAIEAQKRTVEEAAIRARGPQTDASIMSAQQADQLRRRRGRAANILSEDDEPVTVGARRLLGY